MNGLDGRVAIVTGAARGIGRATARLLAREGAQVAICDIDEAGAQAVAAAIMAEAASAPDGAAGPGMAVAFAADISVPEACESLVDAVVARFGRLDILVNNAGICPRITLDDMTGENFDRIMGVNVKSVFFLSRAAGRAMRAKGGGRIVNLGSTSGRVGALYNATVYGASKAAIMSMTKSFARIYAADKILVNCVAPGSVDTGMMDLPPDILDRTLAGVPLGRLSQPEEIARAVVFLCGEGASYMTGATLDVNGGAVMV